MTQTPPEPDFPDPNTGARPDTNPDAWLEPSAGDPPDGQPPLQDDSGDAVPDTD